MFGTKKRRLVIGIVSAKGIDESINFMKAKETEENLQQFMDQINSSITAPLHRCIRIADNKNLLRDTTDSITTLSMRSRYSNILNYQEKKEAIQA